MNNKLKIIIVTQIDPIYTISFFEELFAIIDLKKLGIELEIFDMQILMRVSLSFQKIKFYVFQIFSTIFDIF